MTDTNELNNEQQTQKETETVGQPVGQPVGEPAGQPVDDLNRGIGTKESEKLGAAMVEILEPKIVVIPPKEGSKNKKDSKIVECMVKHPGKEDLIKISQVKYVKGDKIDESGLWYHEDEDMLIPKSSALAILLRHAGVENVSSLTGMKLMTEAGKGGYLAFKAY